MTDKLTQAKQEMSNSPVRTDAENLIFNIQESDRRSGLVDVYAAMLLIHAHIAGDLDVIDHVSKRHAGKASSNDKERFNNEVLCLMGMMERTGDEKAPFQTVQVKADPNDADSPLVNKYETNVYKKTKQSVSRVQDFAAWMLDVRKDADDMPAFVAQDENGLDVFKVRGKYSKGAAFRGDTSVDDVPLAVGTASTKSFAKLRDMAAKRNAEKWAPAQNKGKSADKSGKGTTAAHGDTSKREEQAKTSERVKAQDASEAAGKGDAAPAGDPGKSITETAAWLRARIEETSMDFSADTQLELKRLLVALDTKYGTEQARKDVEANKADTSSKGNKGNKSRQAKAG